MITGLGEKNISRWLNGHSRASESISNDLRLLPVDSRAFERLKQKNFTDDGDDDPALGIEGVGFVDETALALRFTPKRGKYPRG